MPVACCLSFFLLSAAHATSRKPAPAAEAYAAWCSGCHGENGDGVGLADPELIAPPRDFTTGKFKIRTTETNSPISDEELSATITRGMPGSAMPAFAFLPQQERRALAEHVAVLAGLPAERDAEPIPVPLRPETTDERIAQGERVYRDLGCAVCHGDEGRGDGPAGADLKDVWGNPTPARDLTREKFRGGDEPRDLYLRLAAGMPGTPMPSYRDAATPEQLWALVAWMKSIRVEPPPPPEDPAEWGARIVEQSSCAACHLLGGKGGRIGPSLDVAGRKLRPGWLVRYLLDPTASAKIVPAVPWRMPPLGLSKGEAEAVAVYLGSRAGRGKDRQETRGKR